MSKIQLRNVWIATFLCLIAGQAVGQEPTKEQRDEVLERVTRILTNTAFVPGVDFSKWPEFLATQQEAIEKSKSPGEFAAAVNRALQRFGASHIVFNTPESVKQLREGRVVGIGISPMLLTEGIKINDVFPGSPASLAGIEIGDVIIEADGKKPETVAALRGEENTKIVLKIRKPSGLVRTVEVTRKPFSIKIPESLKWLNDEVAVLKVPSFMNYSATNVEKLMREAAKAKTLVIDLRSNGGGQVTALLHLAGLVLPKGAEMGSWVTRKMVDDHVNLKGGKPTDLAEIAKNAGMKVRPFTPRIPRFEGQVICLVNGGSGSASEMFAAAVRDVLGAPIVGSKSAGQVLASILAPMPHGYQLQYPFQDYVTVKGVRLEGNGVAPDHEAKTPRSPADEDPAVPIILRIAKEGASAAEAKKDGA